MPLGGANVLFIKKAAPKVVGTIIKKQSEKAGEETSV